MRELLPIPGAPKGKVLRRTCQHMGAFTLVRAFHGLLIYQCLTCRKISSVDIRTDKTCLNCGKPLDGKKVNWCSGECGTEIWLTTDRESWRLMVLKCDNYTCQRCGYTRTKEDDEAYKQAYRKNGGKHWQALKEAGVRQLEAHHITPLEWGGPEFDLDNGTCYCDTCHDEVHRELNAKHK